VGVYGIRRIGTVCCVRYGVLGPLEVVGADGPVPVAAPKERLLLVDLIVHANEVVSASQLVSDLWDDNPPRTAAKTPATGQEFFRHASEPASTHRIDGPVDFDRVRASAAAHGGVEMVGPPPFDASRELLDVDAADGA
jgi:hypothetical protein